MLTHDRSNINPGILLAVDQNLLQCILVMVTFNLIWHEILPEELVSQCIGN
jgi:hypothetical protein